MFINRRMSRILLLTIFVICSIAILCSLVGCNKDKKQNAAIPAYQDQLRFITNDKIRQLLNERHEILKKSIKSMKILQEAGRAEYKDIRDATIAILQVEIELCQSQAERIKVYEKIVDFYREQEKHFGLMADAGRLGAFELDYIKADRLQAEVDLERQRILGNLK